MEFGSQIKKAREAKQMSQEQLGAALGVTGVTIMRYEKNQRQPKFEQLIDIANALDISIVDLFEEPIASALKTVVDSNIDSAEQVIKEYYGISGPFTIVETADDEVKRLFHAYSTLNHRGQEKVIAYTEDLNRIPEYKRINKPQTDEPTNNDNLPQEKENPPEGR